MSRAASPTPPCAISPPRSPASRPAAAWSPSPGPASRRTIPPSATSSSPCRTRARIVFTAPIDGRLYAKHGTTIDTRLTVIDRIPTDRPDHLPASAAKATDLAALLASLQASLPPRAQAVATPLKALSTALRPQPRPVAPRPTRPVAGSARASRRNRSPTKPASGRRPPAAA